MTNQADGRDERQGRGSTVRDQRNTTRRVRRSGGPGDARCITRLSTVNQRLGIPFRAAPTSIYDEDSRPHPCLLQRIFQVAAPMSRGATNSPDTAAACQVTIARTFGAQSDHGKHRPFGRVIADRVTESARPSCPRTPAPACQHQGPPPWTSDASMARRSTAASGADVHDVHPGAGGGGAGTAQDRNALLASVGNLCTSAACRLHPRPVLRRVRAASGCRSSTSCFGELLMIGFDCAPT